MTSPFFSDETIPGMIEASCRKFNDAPAMGFAFEPPLSYGEFHQKTLLLAAWLKNHGVKKQDPVAILGENSPAWGMAYLAASRVGAVVIPILPDFPASDVKHILADSEAKLLFTTQRQLEKIAEPGPFRLKRVVTLDDSSDPNRIVETTKLSELVDEAESLPEKKRANHAEKVAPDDLASIIYTSGTSGHSKAVMLTHRNFTSNVSSTKSILPPMEDIRGWTFLSILPMSHAYEFTTSFLMPLSYGARIVYAGKTPTPSILEKICKEEKPTIMCMVPMVLEKIYKKRLLPAIGKNRLVRSAVRIPFLRKKIMQAIGKKLHQFFGGELLFVAIGGAALNPEVERFLAETGFPFLCGYGLTEASPLVSAGPWGDPTIAMGSSGKPVKDVQVRIVDVNPETGLGEIQVRGPNVMKGYYKNPEATRQTIDPEGWLSTGDLGRLDEHNNLFIEGRSKSVIVLSHGENIYPETIEERINAYPEVIESLVIENNDKLEAWVYLDYELIDEATRGKSQQEKLQYIKEILRRIHKGVNAQLPRYSQIHRFIERQEPFIKTATHKIKRYLYTSCSQKRR